MDLNRETALRPVTLPSGRTFLESPRIDRISAQLKELVVEDYAKTGNLDASCKKLGVIPRVFRLMMNQDSILMQSIMDAREGLCDKAEGHIVEHMGNRGNTIDRLAWLRAWRPAIWNPKPEFVGPSNVEVTVRLAGSAQTYIDTTATAVPAPAPSEKSP